MDFIDFVSGCLCISRTAAACLMLSAGGCEEKDLPGRSGEPAAAAFQELNANPAVKR